MRIVKYQNKYLSNINELIVELEDYIISIDKDNLDQRHPKYQNEIGKILIKNMIRNKGVCFLVIEKGKVIGLVMGEIRKYTRYDYLDYKCPKEGIITNLIVTKDYRNNGIGEMLLRHVENHFKKMKCEYVILDVFAYNKKAIQFYHKRGYHPRMITEIKKL